MTVQRARRQLTASILSLVAASAVLVGCGDPRPGDAGAPPPSAGPNSAGPNSAGPSSAAPSDEPFVEFRQAEPGSGTGVKIGLIALDDAIPFSKLVSDSVRKQAERAGAELVFCDSKLDAAKALECARSFNTQGVQGYLNFQPVADAAQPICQTGPQGVPVIAIDIRQGDCQTAFMGANNSRAGQVAGEGLGKFLKEKHDCKYDAYISLEDKAVGSVNNDRMNGIREGLTKVCGAITNERVLDAGRQDLALTKFGDTLTALPDAKKIVVVGINDDSVLGALAAARTAGRADQLLMAGMGADPTAHCEIAKNPNWAGDAGFFPERYGEIGVPYLIDAIKGKQVPASLLVDHVFIDASTIGDYYDVERC